MAKTNLQLKSVEVGTEKKMTTTITYVNPDADSATLKEFGQKLNELTANTYVETNRIQTINVDTEQVPIAPTAATLTLNAQSSYTLQNYGTEKKIQIPLSDFVYEGSGNINNIFGVIKHQNTATFACERVENTLFARIFTGGTTGTYTLNLCVPGATQLENAYLQTTINVTE